jgi:hypothetical protein
MKEFRYVPAFTLGGHNVTNCTECPYHVPDGEGYVHCKHDDFYGDEIDLLHYATEIPLACPLPK